MPQAAPLQAWPASQRSLHSSPVQRHGGSQRDGGREPASQVPKLRLDTEAYELEVEAPVVDVSDWLQERDSLGHLGDHEVLAEGRSPDREPQDLAPCEQQ
eukprot:419962-Rhodomonas_salina.2